MSLRNTCVMLSKNICARRLRKTRQTYCRNQVNMPHKRHTHPTFSVKKCWTFVSYWEPISRVRDPRVADAGNGYAREELAGVQANARTSMPRPQPAAQPRAVGSRRAPLSDPSRPATPVASSSWPPVAKYCDGKCSDHSRRFMLRRSFDSRERLKLKSVRPKQWLWFPSYHVRQSCHHLLLLDESSTYTNKACGKVCGSAV